MTDDCDTVCDEMFDGCNGSQDIETPAAGCPGCCYILGAAAAFGLVGMAEAIRERYPMIDGPYTAALAEWWNGQQKGER